MKNLSTLFVLGALAGGVLLTGCSKSKTAATPAAGQDPAAGSTTATADPASPADLKIHWAAGKVFPMRMDLTQTTETHAPNQPDPEKQEVKLAQDFDLSALQQLDNGGWEFGLQFKSETLDVSAGGHSLVSFDSAQSRAQDGDNPAAPILRAMIGAHLQYFTDPAGKVEKMGGMDDLLHRINAAAKPEQRAMFQQMYNEDTLKQYGSFADALPNRIVNVGESWPVKYDLSSPIGTLTMDLKSTFKNWEQHNGRLCAHIETTGKISSKTVSAAMVGAAVEIEKGKISGDVWFDPKPGMVVDLHNNQDMTLKIATRTQTLQQGLNVKVRLSSMDAG